MPVSMTLSFLLPWLASHHRMHGDEINLQYVLVPELVMTSRPPAMAPAIDLHPAQGIQVSQPRGGIQCSHLVQATVAAGK